MTKSKTGAFDAANDLDTEEDIAEYVRQVLVDNDPIELAAALGDLARARHVEIGGGHWPVVREPLQKSLRRACAQQRHAVQGHPSLGLRDRFDSQTRLTKVSSLRPKSQVSMKSAKCRRGCAPTFETGRL